MPKGLGRVQEQVLLVLAERNGKWATGCGWAWGSALATQRIMDSLFRRNLVDRHARGSQVMRMEYELTSLGRRIAAAIRESRLRKGV